MIQEHGEAWLRYIVNRPNAMVVNTIRYDTRCYFNVRSKADMSQLNLPHAIAILQLQYVSSIAVIVPLHTIFFRTNSHAKHNSAVTY